MRGRVTASQTTRLLPFLPHKFSPLLDIHHYTTHTHPPHGQPFFLSHYPHFSTANRYYSLFHSDSSLKTFRHVKIHASKLRLLACLRSSNCNDLLPNMKTQRSAVSLKRLLPDTGLRIL
ncbi:hypothetical protein TNCV_2330831 [Trichonephila clavipes]|nr:hypothetical protein TNCV_2330831 [Trichonephila clavipes]